MTILTHDFAANAIAHGPVIVEELAPTARFALRVRPGPAATLAPALGLELPNRIGTVATRGARTALCLGPDEWLVTAPEAEAPAIAEASAGAYTTTPHGLTEISDRTVTLALSGEQADTLLAAACPRDLSTLAPGHAARTVFDGLTVVVWRDAPDRLRIDLPRSSAHHAAALIAKVQRELAVGL